MEAGGSLALEAGGSLAVLGADLRAEKDVTASAGQGLVIGGVTVEERVNVGDGDTYDRWSRTSHRGSTIEAGGSISTLSLGDTLIQGSKLRAGENVDITALGGVTIEAARDTYDSAMQRNGGKKAGTSHSVHNVRSEIEAGNHIAVTSLSGDVTAQAVKFAANKPGDGTVALTAQQGQVALTSVTDEESWTYKSSSSNIATYKMRNAGAVDTTVAMTEVDADGGLVVKAGKGVVVEYRDAGSLEASLATLSTTPGLEWMETLAKRDDVAWKAVQEAHEHWDYKSQGLSAPAAAIIAIAVSIATAGAGAGTGALLGVENAALAAGIDAAASAGIGTLASQAAVSLVNNQGDIGKVLKELGSSESIRSLLVSMASAAAFSGVGSLTDGHFVADGRTLERGLTPTQYMQTVEYVQNIAGHAAVGCAAALASGQSCGSGAAAAALSGAAGPLYIGAGTVGGTVLASATGGLGAGLTGGDITQGMTTGAMGYLFNDMSSFVASLGLDPNSVSTYAESKKLIEELKAHDEYISAVTLYTGVEGDINKGPGIGGVVGAYIDTHGEKGTFLTTNRSVGVGSGVSAIAGVQFGPKELFFGDGKSVSFTFPGGYGFGINFFEKSYLPSGMYVIKTKRGNYGFAATITKTEDKLFGNK